MGPYKVSNYSTTEGEKGFGNRDYEATTTFSVTLSIDATRNEHNQQNKDVHLRRTHVDGLPGD